jgi:glycosyltransferase involved in cell wall biosynthesis
VAADPRIEIRPGDPLPVLHGARLYVHPSWEEGFGYGAAEAWACGLPLVLTHDTGMQDRLGPEDPVERFDAGDTATLAALIEAARQAG